MNPVLIEQVIQLLLAEFLQSKANDFANAPFIEKFKAALAANRPLDEDTLDALLAGDDAADAALQAP